MSAQTRWTTAGLAVVLATAIGCINIKLPERVNVSGGGPYVAEAGSITRIDPSSLPSVMIKLRDINKEIGEELGDRDWEAVGKEGANLAQWANRAAGLKAQSTSPDTFAAHCASLASHGAAIQQAAVSADVTRTSADLSQATRLLGLMDQLVK